MNPFAARLKKERPQVQRAADKAVKARELDKADTNHHTAWSRYGNEIESALVAVVSEIDTNNPTTTTTTSAPPPVRLLDARFLMELARSKCLLPPRQDVPPQAFLDVEHLSKMPSYSHELRVLCLSYCWLHPHHPDPRGDTVQLLGGKILPVFVSDSSLEDGASCTWAVFWDYGSLMQKDLGTGRRTLLEQQLFDRALSSLSQLYAATSTFILKVTQLPPGYPEQYYHESLGDSSRLLLKETNTATYEERGWCFCESACGDLVKPSWRVLDLAKVTKDTIRRNYLKVLISECNNLRQPPLLPTDFAAALETKSFTSRKSDLDHVKAIYQQAFENEIVKAGRLIYHNLGWNDAHVIALCKVLFAAKCVTVLNMVSNGIGDDGAMALAACLQKGGAPALKALEIGLNPGISQASINALKKARKGLSVRG